MIFIAIYVSTVLISLPSIIKGNKNIYKRLESEKYFFVDSKNKPGLMDIIRMGSFIPFFNIYLAFNYVKHKEMMYEITKEELLEIGKIVGPDDFFYVELVLRSTLNDNISKTESKKPSQEPHDKTTEYDLLDLCDSLTELKTHIPNLSTEELRTVAEYLKSVNNSLNKQVEEKKSGEKPIQRLRK